MNLYLNPSTSLAPFSAPANAVIVTPPLKTDAAPNTGLVIAPRLGGVRFHNHLNKRPWCRSLLNEDS